MVIVDMFVGAIGAYVVYRQESIEKKLTIIIARQLELESKIPKRWMDRLTGNTD